MGSKAEGDFINAMLSLLRPRKARRKTRHASSFNSSSPIQRRRDSEVRHAQADWTETDNDDDFDPEMPAAGPDEEDEDGEDQEEDEDGQSATPLLPIFSAAHLGILWLSPCDNLQLTFLKDSLPVYNLTHAIRIIILPRVETQLTWDQLRSPQVSQFLIKPMQQQIRNSHFSRATLYALMANCLQFGKEGQMNPGSSGTSKTRAMVCELLALKLIKEYNTRELIDALSYDFYPLQGLAVENDQVARQNSEFKNRAKGAAARISTLEVAIRGQAKKFLAHGLVVQQLEAIWAGTIVFHSTADHLHRQPPTPQQRPGSGDTETSALLRGSTDKAQSKRRAYSEAVQMSARRTVTLYDPRDASLFKLSRLRVPRYRQFFSTCSLAILLGLFLAVLSQRSSDITRLEIVFWLWSAGFMLDEVVGFNEQGFSLYLMSFWNTFDLGILLIFFVYYCMRIYGIFLIEGGRHEWNSMAYDVLAANAVLLFPRLFSVLDHYRYFSQLLIAFRLMAVDLVAVFVLILISCSGFFVAFTLSFGDDYNGKAVAYGLFQMLMGFTPAAWSVWEDYNLLGQAILTVFLFMCHFLIVTILITVLTNSFMAIVSNANEEHQFVFAVNTISMVKSDALFSYLAPSNILAWVLTPLRYIMPFRSFVKLNRTIIKITHFPLLWSIFAYEKMFLARKVYEPTDLVENRGRDRKRMISFMDPASRGALFSPGARLRTESMAAVQKDRALDQVFTLAPRGNLRSTIKKDQTTNVVNSWIDQQEGIASPPPEQDRSIVDRLERNRQASKRGARNRALSRGASGVRSVASDPADLMSTGIGAREDFAYNRAEVERPNMDPQTEDEGDDELVTNDEEENLTLGRFTQDNRSTIEASHELENDYFRTPKAVRSITHALSPRSSSPTNMAASTRRRMHDRHASNATILFNPVSMTRAAPANPPSIGSTSSPVQTRPIPKKYATGTNTPTRKTDLYSRSKPRPILPHRATLQEFPRSTVRHRRSSLDFQLDLNSDFGMDGAAGLGGGLPGVPNSFQTQMAMATAMEARDKRRGEGQELMGRIMLARMKTLEEGFAEVVREFREGRSLATSKAGSIDLSADQKERRDRERREGKKVVRSRPGTGNGLKNKGLARAKGYQDTPVKVEESHSPQVPEESLLQDFDISKTERASL